jgi:DNA repair exonuclease SbcCD ATPase subunit
MNYPGEVSLTLHDTGVTVLTGPNGAGKSRFIEAVAFGIWGKTLRGSNPWSLAVTNAQEIYLETDRGRVVRTQTGRLRFTQAGESAYFEADTKSKTQAALGQHYGDFDVWRRTHVFSSADAAHFSTATDSQRKNLIEAILGLDRFDVAYEAARADCTAALAAKHEAAMKEVSATAKYGNAKATLEHYKKTELPPFSPEPSPTAPTPPTCPKVTQEEVDALHTAASNAYCAPLGVPERSELQAELDYLAKEIRQLKSKIEAAEGQHCPECGQVTQAGQDEQIVHKLHVEFVTLSTRYDDLVSLRSAHEIKYQDAVRTRQTLGNSAMQAYKDAHRSLIALEEYERAIARYKADLAAYTEHQARLKAEHDRRADRLRAQIKAAQQSARDAGAELLDAEEAMADATTNLTVAEAVKFALSTKGVRAHILSSALAGVESLANVWLSRMSSMQIRLSSYTEKKTGGTSDAISLEVIGAGGLDGYTGASGGERRRIDAAILLALAEIASAASGEKPGTLWLDEVFDAIDSESAGLVAAAISELGKDRPVVVITHNADLAEKITASRRLLVRDGEITNIT